MRQTSSDAVESRILEALEQRASALDDATLTRLREVRRQAMTQSGAQSWYRLHDPLPRWAAGLALVVVLVVGGVLWWRIGVQPLPGLVDDLEVLAVSDDLDLLRDLDFYLWLEREQALDEARPAAGRS